MRVSNLRCVAVDRVRALVAAALLLAVPAAASAQAPLPIDQIRLPPGFTISVVARVPNARAMIFGDEGTLFVGSAGEGSVTAVRLPQDGKGDVLVRTIITGLREPAGLAFRNGALYVSAIDRVLRYDNIEHRLTNPRTPLVVSNKFPGESAHGRKFIAFGPDGKLYVPVGAPCNICEPDPNRYANIMRMNPDGSDLEVFARGVRNTVGFDFHPQTGELWFTDNGRDMMGDDIPGDELNRAPRAGMHFGYPYCHAGTVADPQYGKGRPCSEFVPPAQVLGPHVAALGMRFYTGTQFPAAYRNQIFIAEHGSWNRSKRIGYRVTLVKLDASGNATSYEPFAQGWLQDERAWGRPADVIVAPDGSLLVADDYAGVIYRISYRG